MRDSQEKAVRHTKSGCLRSAEKEARELVKRAIGFGSVVVYYEDKSVLPVLKVEYGQVVLETPWFDEENRRYSSKLVPARHATACRKEVE